MYHVNELVYIFDTWNGWYPGLIVGPKGEHGYMVAVNPNKIGVQHTQAHENRLMKVAAVTPEQRDKATEQALKNYNKTRLMRKRQSKKAKGAKRRQTRKNM
jgi:hypothetical protein